MDVQNDKNITAIQSLPHWVYIIQYLLWIVHDIELYVDVIDCELTIAIVHLIPQTSFYSCYLWKVLLVVYYINCF